jgi:hypothetical protein
LPQKLIDHFSYEVGELFFDAAQKKQTAFIQSHRNEHMPRNQQFKPSLNLGSPAAPPFDVGRWKSNVEGSPSTCDSATKNPFPFLASP